MASRVLVTGASVAGNTVAWWLGRYGYDVTVVERAPAFRDGGQNVDVRGAAREVLRRMGLEKAALDLGTGEVGTAWIDAKGRIAARFMLDEAKGDGPTAEMEILRGDLARLLYEAARECATFHFGDSVQAIAQDDSRASVTFASGRTEEYDSVIVAEGVGSSTRDLVFPGENHPRWMDMAIAFFTIPRAADDDRLWRWYHAAGGRSVSLRPDTQGTTRAMLMVQKPPGGEHNWDVGRQKAYLRDLFADVGWETPRLLADLEGAEDFYFETLRQVRMPSWSKGRVTLVGDAAWCLTTLAGFGASMAIIGAYLLAGELARADDVVSGYAAFEKLLRPGVERRQGIPKVFPALMNPKTRLGIRMLHTVLYVASRPAIRAVAALFGNRRRTGPTLPDYPKLDTR